MSHTLGTRQAQKQKTRQALLDAALRLLEHQSLSSLGLRELTREVGIAPAAFYRHFRDMAELGVALVDESFGSLHAMVRATRSDEADTEQVIQRTVSVLTRHVALHRTHFRFLARERHGGVREVRDAIAVRFQQFADELAGDLAARPQTAGWSTEDIQMLADLYVNHMATTAAVLMEVPPDHPEQEQEIARTAHRQLQLISLGCLHWPGG